MTEPFPHLKQLYLERAADLKNRHLPAAMGLGAVSLIMVVLGGASSEPRIWAVAGLGVVFAIVSVLIYTRGQRNFEKNWKQHVAEFCTTLNGADILRRVEEEIAIDSIMYPEVVFTLTHMITFEEFADINRVYDIEQLDVTKYLADGLPRRYIFNLHCSVPGRTITLTQNDKYIDEIFREIRLRHPQVGLTPAAHEYFYPSRRQGD